MSLFEGGKFLSESLLVVTQLKSFATPHLSDLSGKERESPNHGIMEQLLLVPLPLNSTFADSYGEKLALGRYAGSHFGDGRPN